jgi:hypothetical protein
VWWRSPSCIYRRRRSRITSLPVLADTPKQPSVAPCRRLAARARRSMPYRLKSTALASATSARAPRVSHCQTHRLNFQLVLPTVPLCSATVTCVISHQTLFAMCTAPYLLRTTTMDPRIHASKSAPRSSGTVRPVYPCPQHKTGYRVQTPHRCIVVSNAVQPSLQIFLLLALKQSRQQRWPTSVQKQSILASTPQTPHDHLATLYHCEHYQSTRFAGSSLLPTFFISRISTIHTPLNKTRLTEDHIQKDTLDPEYWRMLR